MCTKTASIKFIPCNSRGKELSYPSFVCWLITEAVPHINWIASSLVVGPNSCGGCGACGGCPNGCPGGCPGGCGMMGMPGI